MSDIATARELLEASHKALIPLAEAFDEAREAQGRITEALGLMTRTYSKQVVRTGLKVRDEHRRRLKEIVDLGGHNNKTCAELAEQVFGNTGGAGRISEMLRAMGV